MYRVCTPVCICIQIPKGIIVGDTEAKTVAHVAESVLSSGAEIKIPWRAARLNV